MFKNYIQDHVVSWFTWAKEKRRGVKRMEDLILVSGYTLVSSWAAAAFVQNAVEARISLTRRRFTDGRERFIWRNITKGAVKYHDSDINPVRSPGIVT